MNKNHITLILIIAVLSCFILYSCDDSIKNEASSMEETIPDWALGTWYNNSSTITISNNEVILRFPQQSFHLMEQLKLANGQFSTTPNSFKISFQDDNYTVFYNFTQLSESTMTLTIHTIGIETSYTFTKR